MKRHVQCRRSYALEAERKMGQMLKETERAKGELKRGPVVTTRNHGAKLVRSQDVTAQPTLLTLGLTKRESAEAQMLAELPRSLSYDATAGTYAHARGIVAPHPPRQLQEFSLPRSFGIREGPFIA